MLPQGWKVKMLPQRVERKEEEERDEEAKMGSKRVYKGKIADYRKRIVISLMGHSHWTKAIELYLLSNQSRRL